MVNIAQRNIRAVLVGASAGGIDALKALLEPLDKSFSLPIVIVQHIGMKSSQSLIPLFSELCAMSVKEAEANEHFEPGVVYFAPAGYHLMIESDGTFSLSVDEPVTFSRPSVDVLFESAADSLGGDVLGIVLTGANHDGALGLKKIVEAGGVGIVQCPDTAAFSTMPASALALVKDSLVLTLPEISEYLQTISRGNPSMREV